MLFYRRRSLLVGLALIMASVACQPAPKLASPSAPGIGVEITNDLCPTVVVEVGQQVLWTNKDSHAHIVRENPAKGNSMFDSGTLQPGDSFAYTFIEAGEYSYICTSDGVMTGTVTVQP